MNFSNSKPEWLISIFIKYPNLGVGGGEAKLTWRLTIWSQLKVRVHDYNPECRWSFWRRNRLCKFRKSKTGASAGLGSLYRRCVIKADVLPYVAWCRLMEGNDLPNKAWCIGRRYITLTTEVLIIHAND